MLFARIPGSKACAGVYRQLSCIVLQIAGLALSLTPGVWPVQMSRRNLSTSFYTCTCTSGRSSPLGTLHQQCMDRIIWHLYKLSLWHDPFSRLQGLCRFADRIFPQNSARAHLTWSFSVGATFVQVCGSSERTWASNAVGSVYLRFLELRCGRWMHASHHRWRSFYSRQDHFLLVYPAWASVRGSCLWSQVQVLSFQTRLFLFVYPAWALARGPCIWWQLKSGHMCRVIIGKRWGLSILCYFLGL